MTSVDQSEAKKGVRFFNVSLRNGIVVSTPSYREDQAFLGQLIRSMEAANPEFAWVQFLFLRSNYGQDLVRLKNQMHRAKVAMEQPAIDLVSGQEHDRRELHRDFYRQTETRMKRIDEVASKPTITLAIQGMWVADKDSMRLISTLPFDHCCDAHDSLAVFEYRDPRMLLELVDRRMVVDISPYLDAFTKSRLEPPSFIVTPEELQSFVHLPAGEVIRSIHSVNWGTSMRFFDQGETGSQGLERGVVEPTLTVPSNLVRLAEVPEMIEKLEEQSVQPLDHLASGKVRTLEVVYWLGRTEVLLSSETLDDMGRYATLLASVYGDLKLESTERHPPFLRNLPEIALPSL